MSKCVFINTTIYNGILNITANVTIQSLNERLLSTTSPAICFSAVCMIVGIIGNSLTIIIFNSKLERSSSNIFVSWLAIFDILSCAVVMPFDIYSLRFPLLAESDIRCKVFRYFAHFTNTSATMTLVCIAFDRYYKICKPLHGFSVKKAKACVFLNTCLALIISIPAAKLYGIRRIKTSVPGLYGLHCTMSANVIGTLFPYLYY